MSFDIGAKVKWHPDTEMSTQDSGLIVDQREDGWLGVQWNGAHTIYSPSYHLSVVKESKRKNAPDQDAVNRAIADEAAKAGL